MKICYFIFLLLIQVPAIASPVVTYSRDYGAHVQLVGTVPVSPVLFQEQVAPAKEQAKTPESDSPRASTWTPAPSLPRTGVLRTLLVGLDLSGTVDGTLIAPLSRAVAKANIINVAESTYVVVAAFGTYARVIEDRLIVKAEDRHTLVSALDGVDLKAINDKTDVPALERLIESVFNALSIPGRTLHLDVRVITDGEADNVDPGDNRTFASLLGRPTRQSVLDNGLYQFALTLEARSELPAATVEPEPVVEPASTTAPAREAFPLRWAIALVVSVLIGATLLLRRAISKARLPELPGIPPENASGNGHAARTVSVEVVRTNEEGQPETVYGPHAVPYRLGLPLHIGAGRDSIVRLLAPKAPPRLVSLTFRDDVLRVEPAETPLQVDGAKAEGPVEVPAATRHIVTGGGFEVRITSQAARPEADAVFFKNLRRSRA